MTGKYLLAALILAAVFSSGCASTTGDRFAGVKIDPYEHNQRYLVGVLSFQDTTDVPELQRTGDAFSGVMTGRLQEHSRYRLIEKERIQSIFEAQSFQLSGLVDPETVQEVGKLLGVEALCFTVIESYNYSEDKTTSFIAWIDTQKVTLGVTSRIVSVSTGEVLASAETVVTRGRKKWVAFGFLKTGGFTEKDALIDETMNLAIQKLAQQLSEKAPGK